MSQQGRSAHLSHRGVLGAFINAERKTAGAASDLFKLAKLCTDVNEFNDRCRAAEEFYLSAAAGPMQVQDLPKKYTQARSDIRGAYKAGLDPKRIKSYHAMKKLKADANKPEPVAPVSAPADEDDVIILGADDSTQVTSEEVVVVTSETVGAPATGQRRRRSSADKRDPQEPRSEITMSEALEQGLVFDARTNVLMPEDMRPLVAILSKLPEINRARLIKRFTKEAQRELSNVGRVRAAAPRASHG